MEIDPKKFYLIGIACFSTIALMSIIIFATNFSNMDIFTRISRIASIVFNFTLIGFFYYLYNLLPPEINHMASDEEIKKLLKGEK